MENLKHIEPKYIFKYKTKGHEIDIDTLLSSQYYFNKAIQEIKQHLFPNIDLKIKVEAFNAGSFDVNQIYEIVTCSALFTIQNIEYVSQIFSLLSDYISIKEFLKEDKSSEENIKGDKVEIRVNGNNNLILVGTDALKLYKNNHALHDAICHQGKILENDKKIQGIQIKKKGSDKKELEVYRDTFPILEKQNAYLEKKEKEITKKTILGIHKWETTPKKGSKWGFIFEGRKINQVLVNDEKFIKEVLEKKHRFGAGDCIEADIVIKYKTDETTGLSIESKFEILKVYRIIWRNEQQNLFEQ